MNNEKWGLTLDLKQFAGNFQNPIEESKTMKKGYITTQRYIWLHKYHFSIIII